MEKLKIVLRHNNWLGTMEHGWGNGYVALPKEHPFNGVHYDSIPVDIHGGLTYAEWGTHANKADRKSVV